MKLDLTVVIFDLVPLDEVERVDVPYHRIKTLLTKDAVKHVVCGIRERTIQEVVANFTTKQVNAGSAKQQIVTTGSEQSVVARFAVRGIVAPPTGEQVVPKSTTTPAHAS